MTLPYESLTSPSRCSGTLCKLSWSCSYSWFIRLTITSEKPGAIDVPGPAEGLTGGVLLGVRGNGGVSFFDWQSGGLVRRIEVEPRVVYWVCSLPPSETEPD